MNSPCQFGRPQRAAPFHLLQPLLCLRTWCNPFLVWLREKRILTVLSAMHLVDVADEVVEVADPALDVKQPPFLDRLLLAGEASGVGDAEFIGVRASENHSRGGCLCRRVLNEPIAVQSHLPVM